MVYMESKEERRSRMNDINCTVSRPFVIKDAMIA